MTTAAWRKYALPIVLISILIAGGAYQFWQRADNSVAIVQCAHPLHGCQFQLEQRWGQVSFVNSPSGLHPFTLRVIMPHAQNIFASFAMRDMAMGSNRYRLLHESGNLWQAKVVLPVCVTGRHDWLLTLDIDGKKLTIPFSN